MGGTWFTNIRLFQTLVPLAASFELSENFVSVIFRRAFPNARASNNCNWEKGGKNQDMRRWTSMVECLCEGARLAYVGVRI
jgi:hypothetical protein